MPALSPLPTSSRSSACWRACWRRTHPRFEGIGRACAAEDIPFVFELLAYPFPGEASHTTGYVEVPGKHPQRVVDSVRAFADPRFGVDLFKLESPLPAAALPPCGDSAQSRAAQAWFDQLGAAIATPWVMLSAGASMADFANVLRYAYRAGAHGFLAGRAIWWDPLAAFPDLDACESALGARSPRPRRVRNRRRVRATAHVGEASASQALREAEASPTRFRRTNPRG